MRTQRSRDREPPPQAELGALPSASRCTATGPSSFQINKAQVKASFHLTDKELVHSLFEQVPDRYAERNGGYTRVLKHGFRRGDNAEMGVIELL